MKKSQFVIVKRINLNVLPHSARVFVYKFMPNMTRKWFCRLGNSFGMVHVLLERHTCLEAKYDAPHLPTTKPPGIVLFALTMMKMAHMAVYTLHSALCTSISKGKQKD